MTLTEFLKIYPARNTGTFGDFVKELIEMVNNFEENLTI